MRHLILPLLMLATLASALTAQTPGTATTGGTATAAAPTGNAQNGKKIFDAYGCYQCHGREAQGGVGPRLGPRPLSWTAFSRYVRQPTDQMPPYTAKVVSDQELADIYAFLVGIPAPPAAKGIPILNQ
jgi:mono/diheme cytochrome c family protein